MVTGQLTARRWTVPLATLCVGWLGVNAVWGLTGLDGTRVSRWMVGLAPLGMWLAGAVVVLAGLWGLARRTPSEDTAARCAVILLVPAYLAGLLVFEFMHGVLRPHLGGTGVPASSLTDGLRFALHRSFSAMPLVPMALVWRLTGVRGAASPWLRLGDWRAHTHLELPVLGRISWFGAFLAFMLGIALPVFMWFQMQVGFEPLTSGALLRLAPALVVMALANSAVEELVFRGMFLTALTPATGARAAVWFQAVFFGLHHYGSSPVPMADALTTIAAIILGYIWGRSVIGTRGIGWAVGTHMLADLTFFSVTHVTW